ncbi:tRNA glutamyl-Q(34) synthetase GluQRS [Aurantivibrio plasticivorans]
MTSPAVSIANITPYVGRFAPSPSGPLHFGSLVSALASYLDARHHQGQWLLRVEDLDPPREVAGSADAIVKSLETHKLHWDGEILWQSQRQDAYREALTLLSDMGVTFPCRCTRKAIAALGGIYPGTCRTPDTPIRQDEPVAWRLLSHDFPASVQASHIQIYDDLVFGPQQQDVAAEMGDFIIKRKDGLYAYQLAVVVDDIYQGITHVIRGSDLLESTGPQKLLFQLLGATAPRFGHCPVALNALGQKLSKQHHASPLNDAQPSENLWQALSFLRQMPPTTLRGAEPSELLSWAIHNWDINQVPKIMGYQPPDSNQDR